MAVTKGGGGRGAQQEEVAVGGAFNPVVLNQATHVTTMGAGKVELIARL